jgi:ATP-dependent Clp protease ATP-binding subunit ClpC
MTSNIGSQHINREPGIGLRQETLKDETEKDYEAMKKRVQDELKRVFRPEFLNRLDETVVFHALKSAEIHQIVDLMLGSVRKQVESKGMQLLCNNAVVEKLATTGYDPQYGARPLRRAVQRLIEDPLSEEVLLGRFSAGDTIMAELDGEGESATIHFRRVESEFGDPEMVFGDPEPLMLGDGKTKELPPLPPESATE